MFHFNPTELDGYKNRIVRLTLRRRMFPIGRSFNQQWDKLVFFREYEDVSQFTINHSLVTVAVGWTELTSFRRDIQSLIVGIYCAQRDCNDELYYILRASGW